MAEITVDDVAQTLGRPTSPTHHRYIFMAGEVRSDGGHPGHQVPLQGPGADGLLGHIVRAERNYEGKRWVSYNRQFRRDALEQNGRLWTPGYITRRLLGGPEQLLVARVAWPTTMQRPAAPTAQYLAGCCPPRHGRVSQQLNRHPAPHIMLSSRGKFANITMRVGARMHIGADTGMLASTARWKATPRSSAATGKEEGDGAAPQPEPYHGGRCLSISSSNSHP